MLLVKVLFLNVSLYCIALSFLNPTALDHKLALRGWLAFDCLLFCGDWLCGDVITCPLARLLLGLYQLGKLRTICVCGQSLGWITQANRPGML